MHINNVVEKLNQYFSDKRFDKVKKIVYDPLIQCVVIGVTGIIMLFVVTPRYVQKEYDRRIGQPLQEIQQEYFRREEIRMQKEGERRVKMIQDMLGYEEEWYEKQRESE